MIKNEHIYRTATRVLAERPNATLQTIAQEAGISRTTIFNRFPTRELLLQALSNDALTQIHNALSSLLESSSVPYPQRLYEVTEQLIPLAPQSMFLRNVPTANHQINDPWSTATEPLALYLFKLQNEGHINRDIPGRWLVASYVGLLFAAWDEITLGELGTTQACRLVVHSLLRGAEPTSSQRQVGLT